MIYTKTKLKDGAVVCSPVTAKSTYTRCAMCGKEIQMDLRELILVGAQDPYDTEVNCAECSAKMMQRGDIDIRRFGHYHDSAGQKALPRPCGRGL